MPPRSSISTERFDCIIISDTLNFAADVQRVLERLHCGLPSAHPPDHQLSVGGLAARPGARRALGLRPKEPPSNWLATSDILGLMDLADWSPLMVQPRILCPVELLGIGSFLNRWVGPLFSWFCLTVFCVARPVRSRPTGPLTVSVVIPARNEAGNIEGAVRRTPEMGAGTELIFVEGHSKDNTWDEIERVAREISRPPDQDAAPAGHAARATPCGPDSPPPRATSS